MRAQQLRAHRLTGHSFKRQQPIGRFVVDFICLRRRLIIEVDGDHHQSQLAADRERTEFLEALGYTVLRFSNHEVLEQTAAVLQRVRGRAGARTDRRLTNTSADSIASGLRQRVRVVFQLSALRRAAISNSRDILHVCETNSQPSSSGTESGSWPTLLEIPGANGQGRTKAKARESLAAAIKLILADRREDALRGLPRSATRETVTVS